MDTIAAGGVGGMASETATRADVETETAREPWQAGIAGGLVGGIIFGAMMTMEMQTVMEAAIPGMYGLSESLELGWIIHLVHSAVFGVVFAAIVGYTAVGDRISSPLELGVTGLAFGLVVWVVAASVLMPAWVGATTPMDPPVPDFVPASAMGHAVYGVLLGVVYAILRR